MTNVTTTGFSDTVRNLEASAGDVPVVATAAAKAAAANIDPATIKAVVDAVFSVLETLTASRPIANAAIRTAHALFDQLFTTSVAAKVSAKLRS